jgi:hypothetical protein
MYKVPYSRGGFITNDVLSEGKALDETLSTASLPGFFTVNNTSALTHN